MITASVSGKLAFDASIINTKSGVPMTKARIACDDGSGGTLWIDLIGFKGNAEWLARAIKGDRVAAMGILKVNKWQNDQGEDREQLQIVADSLICPAPKPKNNNQSSNNRSANGQASTQANAAPRRKSTAASAPADPFAGNQGVNEDDLPF